MKSDGMVISMTFNEYSDGRLVLQTEKDGNGNVNNIKKFGWNDNNDMNECLITVPKESGEFRFTYEYEYDKLGNWIKRTQFYDGNIINIVTRNITYFDSKDNYLSFLYLSILK